MDLQCLFSHAPALRQLVLDGKVPLGCTEAFWWGLQRRDFEVLVRLRCQQLDLLTVFTEIIGDQSVTLLARIQCPLKLRIDLAHRSWLRSAPLFSLLAELPNLVALQLSGLLCSAPTEQQMRFGTNVQSSCHMS